jgi:hypothetical protein
VGTPIIKEIDMTHGKEYKIVMSAEYTDFGNKTSVEGFADDLNDMSDIVLDFLQAMGFTYVYDVSFHKEPEFNLDD